MTLIERLKAAPGPDRELDAQIWCAVNGYEFIEWDGAGCRFVGDGVYRHTNADNIRKWTASIDAALALVERMLPESGYMLTRGRCSPDEPLFGFQIYRSDFIQDDAGPEPIGLPSEHNSLPLAILIALFTALEGKDTTHADK